jgi:hypothetical protein
MQARRFLQQVFGLCAGAAVLVAGTSAVFDPTGLLQAAGYRQTAACTRGLRGDEATVKAHAALVAQAKTQLVGTSQVAIGFDPAALPPAWSDGGGFNLGIGGATLQTLSPLLSSLVEAPHTARIVLGLSPSMLDRDARHPDAGPGIGRTAMLLVTALLSRDATLESLRLWFDPDSCRHPAIRADGLRSFTPRRDWRQDRDELGMYIARVTRSGIRAQQRSDLDALLAGICRPGIQIFIALTPHQADWLLAYWEHAGAWRTVEQFKRDVTEAGAQAQRNGCAISVHDFNVVSAWTRVPRQSPGGPFLDYVHFRPAVGRAMLDVLASEGDADHREGNGGAEIGRRLTPETLEAHLASQRAALTELAGSKRPAPAAVR